jgi:hypothetical protein
MRTTWCRALAVLCGTWLSACAAGDRATSEGVVVRDSAGVRIVENTIPAWRGGEAWRVGDEPELRIGVVDGDPRYQFFHMMGAWRLDGGRLVVADGGTRELRFYDAAGRFLSAAGGRGEGPGEFQQVDRLFVAGDSLRVYDLALQRVSTFTVDGGFARSSGLPKLEESPMPRPLGWFADGSFLVEATPPFWRGEMQTGIKRIRAHYFRVSPAGQVQDSLGEFAGGEHYILVEGKSVASMVHPFARISAVVVGADRIYFGTSDTYEIESRSPDGRLEQLIRRAHENIRVTPEHLSDFIRERQRYAPNEDARRGIEATLREMPLAATMPAHGRMLLDVEGNLWVEEYLPPGSPTDERGSRWAAFTAEGRWLGIVELPARFEPYQIGADFVLGRWVDELDVQYLELYRLSKDQLARD